MNVLILCHEFPPIGGGYGTYARRLAVELVESGHRVSVLTGRYKDILHDDLGGKLNIRTVWSSRKSKTDNNIVRTFIAFVVLGYFRARKMMREEQYDAVHAFSSIPAGFLGYLLKRRRGPGIALTIAGSDVPYHTELKAVVWLKPLIRLVWKRMDAVISSTRYLIGVAARTYPAADYRFVVIAGGIHQVEGVPLQGKRGQRQQCRMLTIGRLVEIKGIQDVLQALAVLKARGAVAGLEFRIVGDGPYRNQLEKLAREYGVAGQVVFLGYVDDVKKNEELAQADFLITTPRFDNAPYVLLEAMTYGLPIITTDVGGIAEVVDGSIGLLVNKNNVDEIAGAIVEMVENRDRFKREIIIEKSGKYNWDHVTHGHLELYQKISGRH